MSNIWPFLAMEITPQFVIEGLQATTSNDNAIRKNAENTLNEVWLLRSCDLVDE